jgi:hypothetical protein
MSFFLLILATGVLLIRPSDFISELETVQLYLILLVACLVTSAVVIPEQLSVTSLKRRPITACVLGLLVAMLLSDLGNYRLEGLLIQGLEFFKVILYYVLLVGLVNSRSRLRCYLLSVAGILIVPVGLAVLQYYEYINLPAFVPMEVDRYTGMLKPIQDGRLCGTGIFGDPNDVCLLINVGMMLSLYGLLSAHGRLVKVLWLAPLVLFVVALRATESRGGFLAALASIAVLFVARFGIRKGLLLAAVAFAVILSQFGSRQTDFDLSSNGTGQARIQLWESALLLFKTSPVFGVGVNQAGKHLNKAVHNSFIQTYADLGFLGGTLLVGAFYYAFRRLIQLQRRSERVPDPELDFIRPFILAALTGYSLTMMTTNHPYEAGTYGILGIAMAYIRLADADQPPPGEVLGRRMMARLILVGIGYLGASYLYIKVFLHY